MEEIYIYNGNEFSKAEVEAAALEKNLTFEEYLAKFGITIKSPEPSKPPEKEDVMQSYFEKLGKKKGVTKQPVAAVTPDANATDTDSPSVDTSSESLSPITADDFLLSEEAFNKKLSPYLNYIGGRIEEKGLFGANVVKIVVGDDPSPTSFQYTTYGGTSPGYTSPGLNQKKSENLKTGGKTTPEQREKQAKYLNNFLAIHGDLTYNDRVSIDPTNIALYNDYKEVVAIPEEELAEENIMQYDIQLFEHMLKREEDHEQAILNAARSGKESAIIKQTARGYDEKVKHSFRDSAQEKRYNQWKNNGVISDYTEEELDEIRQERKQKYAFDKSDEFAYNLTKTQRKALGSMAYSEQNDFEKTVEKFDKEFKAHTTTSLEAVQKAIEDYENNPTSREKYMKAKRLQQAFIEETNRLQEQQINLQTQSQKKEILPLAISDFLANYNRLQQITTGFKSIGTDILYSLLQIGQFIGGMGPEGAAQRVINLKRTPKERNVELEKATGIITMRKRMDIETESYQRPIAVEEIRTLKDFARWSAGASANLIPSLTMAFTGPAALPLFGLSGAGSAGMEIAVNQKDAAERMIANQKILDENPNMDMFKRVEISNQMNEDSKILNLSNWEQLGIQGLYAVAEMVYERLGTISLIKGAKAAMKSLPPLTIKEGFKYAGKQVGKGFTKEGGSEFATTLTQNFGDIYILGEDKNFFEGGLESFAQGALMGVGISGTPGARALGHTMASELATRSEYKRMREITAELRELTGLTSLQNVPDGNIKIPNQSPQVQTLIEELTQESNDIKESIVAKLGNGISIQQAYEVGEINRELRKINNRFNALMRDKSLSPQQLVAAEKQFKEQYEDKKQEREDILTDPDVLKENQNLAINENIEKDIREGYQIYDTRMLSNSIFNLQQQWENLGKSSKQGYYEEAKKALRKDATKYKRISEKEIKEKANELFIEKSYRKKIEDGEANVRAYAEAKGLDVNIYKAETIEEAMDFMEENGFIEDVVKEMQNDSKYKDLDGEALFKEAKAQLRLAIETGRFEGANLGKNAIVYMPNAIRNGKIGIFAHEVLHVETKEKYGSEATIEQAGKDLLNYLEQNDPDLYARVKYRIDQSYTRKNREGGIEKEASYYEEAMNAMSDIIADGQSIKTSSLNTIRRFVNNFLPTEFKFKETDQRAVFNFVKDFNKQAHFGKKPVKLEDVLDKTSISDDDKTTKLSKTKPTAQENKIEFEARLKRDFPRATKEQIDTQLRLLSRSPSVRFREMTIKEAKESGREFRVNDRGDVVFIEEGPLSSKDKKTRLEEARKISGVKFSKTIAKDIDQAYNEGKSPFDIAMMYEPLVNKLSQKYKNVPDFNILKEDLVQNALYEKGGVIDLINDFDGRGTLSGYVGKLLPLRMNKFAGDLFGQKFTEDVTEKVNIAAQETLPEQIERQEIEQKEIEKTKKQIGRNVADRLNLSSEINDVVRAEVPKILATVTKKITDLKGRRFRNAFNSNVRTLLFEAVGNEIKSLSSIGNFKDYKKWVEENAEELYNVVTKEAMFKSQALQRKFIEEKKDKDGKTVRIKETFAGKKSYAGNLVYEKKPWSPKVKKAWIKELTDSGLNFRQRRIFITNQIAQELAGDYIMEAFDLDIVKLGLKESQKIKRDALAEDIERNFKRGRFLRYSVTENNYRKNPIVNQIYENYVLPRAAEYRNENPTLSIGDSRYLALQDYSKLIEDNIGEAPPEQLISIIRDELNEVDEISIKETSLTYKKAGKIVDRTQIDRLNHFSQKEKTDITDILQNKINKDSPFWLLTEKRYGGISSRLNRFTTAAPVTKKGGEYYFKNNISQKTDYTPAELAQEWVNEINPTWKNSDTRKKYAIKLQGHKNPQILTASQFLRSERGFFNVVQKQGFEKIRENNFERVENFRTILRQSDIDILNVYNELLQEAKNAEPGTPESITANEKLATWEKFMEAYEVYLTGTGDAEGSVTPMKAISDVIGIVVNDNSTDGYFEHYPPSDRLVRERRKGIGNAIIQIRKGNLKEGLAIVNKTWEFLNENAVGVYLDKGWNKIFGQGELRSKLGRGGLSEKITTGSIESFSKELNREKEKALYGEWFKNTIEIHKQKNGKYNIDAIKFEFETALRAGMSNNVPLEQQEIVLANHKALREYDEKTRTVKLSKSAPAEFGDMIDRKSKKAQEIKSAKDIVSATRLGRIANYKNKWNILFPYSAEDFYGLLQKVAGKGEQGNKDLQFLKEKLLDTYSQGISDLETDRMALMQSFRQLKNVLKKSPEYLNKKLTDVGLKDFRVEDAVRVFVWKQLGYEIPGLTANKIKKLNDYVEKNNDLRKFAFGLMVATKTDKYPKPENNWEGGNVGIDLANSINKTKRAKYLKKWLRNVDVILSDKNKAKLTAAFGSDYVKTLEDTIARMKSGSNRKQTSSAAVNETLDFINGSVGTVMFFNMRSATLQSISAVNYMNWSDNNPLQIGKAMLNAPQFIKDFGFLFNSDFLTNRRQGLKINIQEAELADIVSKSRNKPKAMLAYLLKQGFLPTQIVDSFAIASGGASFYRNRINTYIKQGLSEKKAEEKAYQDWRQISNEAQQSSDPSRISQAQADTILGRLVFAWANTPMQYMRLTKKAFSDLINRRGDDKTNISKITYYMAVQNIFFNYMQNAVFALGFPDDEDEVDEFVNNPKTKRAITGMQDSVLRGLGYKGAMISMLKNATTTWKTESAKEDWPGGDFVKVILAITDISPPIDHKARKLKAMWDISQGYYESDIPPSAEAAIQAASLINIPLDRIYLKIQNLQGAANDDYEDWMRVAMFFGWPTYQLVPKPKKENKKSKGPSKNTPRKNKPK